MSLQSIIQIVDPYYGLNIYNIGLTAAIITVALIVLKQNIMGGRMFEHKHKWVFLYERNGWNSYYCEDCLAEASQTIDMTSGLIERHIFNVPTIKRK